MTAHDKSAFRSSVPRIVPDYSYPTEIGMLKFSNSYNSTLSCLK